MHYAFYVLIRYENTILLTVPNKSYFQFCFIFLIFNAFLFIYINLQVYYYSK